MDRPAVTFVPTRFRTPSRLLIPKREKSRDQWKAKAAAAKIKLHARGVRIRDLELSRGRWKALAMAAEEQRPAVDEQRRRAPADLAAARARLARLDGDAQKN